MVLRGFGSTVKGLFKRVENGNIGTGVAFYYVRSAPVNLCGA